MTIWEDALSSDLLHAIQTSPITFYEILKISPNSKKEEIKNLWNQRKKEKLSREEYAAFHILLQEKNRATYDKMLYEKENENSWNLWELNERHNALISKKRWLIIQKERDKIKELLETTEDIEMLNQQNRIKHLESYYQNENGYYVLAKDPQNIQTIIKIDVFQIDNECYLYRITDILGAHLIASTEYFNNWNKTTSRFGIRIRSNSIIDRVCNNLSGYFWIMERDWFNKSNVKYEYFQNDYGNQYAVDEMNHDGTPMVLQITNLDKTDIQMPKNIYSKTENNNRIIYDDLTNFHHIHLFGNTISKDQKEMILQDVRNTNQEDEPTIKRILFPSYTDED